MGTEFRMTDGPQRVTAVGATKQAAKDALDALAYDHADFFLVVYESTGAGPSVAVTLETSMQNVSDDDLYWTNVVTFTTVTTTFPIAEKKNIQPSAGMLRYLRWKATLGANTSGFTFELSGIGRPG